jgi:hypothetical protein
MVVLAHQIARIILYAKAQRIKILEVDSIVIVEINAELHFVRVILYAKRKLVKILKVVSLVIVVILADLLMHKT